MSFSIAWWTAIIALSLGLPCLGSASENDPSAESGGLSPHGPDSSIYNERNEYEFEPAGAENIAGAAASAAKEQDHPPLWFPVGERLTYTIRWGPFKVGTTVVSSQWVEDGDRELLAIRVATRSTPFFDKIYRVDDFIESLIEPVGFTPVRFTKKLNEGRNTLHEVTTFDHEAGTACWSNLVTHAFKKLVIEPDTRCLLSFMFYMRLYDFEPDATNRFQVMADNNIHQIDVVTRSYETVRTPGFGRVRCLLIEPEAPFHGLFVRVGKIQIWISDDDRVVCTQATAGIIVGSISVVLQNVEGPGDDLWSRRGGG